MLRHIFNAEEIEIVHGHAAFSTLAHEALFIGSLMGLGKRLQILSHKFNYITRSHSYSSLESILVLEICSPKKSERHIRYGFHGSFSLWICRFVSNCH